MTLYRRQWSRPSPPQKKEMQKGKMVAWQGLQIAEKRREAKGKGEKERYSHLNDQPRQDIKNQSHYFTDKGPSSQSYGFSSSYVWMWELDHIESWVPNNWCFWTVVLENTLESSLDCKDIQPVHPKRDHFWIFIWRTDTKVEIPILWPPDVKDWLIGKSPDAGKD